MGTQERKAALRAEIKARRAGLSPQELDRASRSAAWHALAGLPWRERPLVAVFWPLAGELDTRPLLHALHWLGAMPLLPRMQGRRQPLAFHAWTPELPLHPGPLGVLEPEPGLPALRPDIVLTPLLAFDRQGGRLGYGAGFYDRTFASLAEEGSHALRCGLALALQEVPAVPETDQDVRLQMIITEAGARCLPD